MADSLTGSATQPGPAGEVTHPESSQPSPEYLDLKHRVHRRLVERINLERLAEIDAPRVRREVREAVAALVAEEDAGLEHDVGERLIEEVLNEVFGLGPLEPLMADPTISDILVTTPKMVHVERDGKLVKTTVRFKDNAHLQRIIQKIVSYTGRRIDESSPMVDARLPDGSRVNAVIPPIAVEGPLLSIRRFSKDTLNAIDLIRTGTLSAEMLELLSACVRSRLNILIVGGTGTGKTTLLNVLSEYIGQDERIVTIEDTAELQLRQEHVAAMETRPANIEGEGAIKQRHLLINSLRMRPDRIIVGEVRGRRSSRHAVGHEHRARRVVGHDSRQQLRRCREPTGVDGWVGQLPYVHHRHPEADYGRHSSLCPDLQAQRWDAQSHPNRRIRWRAWWRGEASGAVRFRAPWDFRSGESRRPFSGQRHQADVSATAATR